MGIIDVAWQKRISENNNDNFGIAEISKGLLEMSKMAYSVGWLDSDSARKNIDGAKTSTNNRYVTALDVFKEFYESTGRGAYPNDFTVWCERLNAGKDPHRT